MAPRQAARAAGAAAPRSRRRRARYLFARERVSGGSDRRGAAGPDPVRRRLSLVRAPRRRPPDRSVARRGDGVRRRVARRAAAGRPLAGRVLGRRADGGRVAALGAAAVRRRGAAARDAGVPLEPGGLAGSEVFYGYGELDAMIPPALTLRSRTYLREESGARAEIHGYRAGHELAPAEQRDLARWYAALT